MKPIWISFTRLKSKHKKPRSRIKYEAQIPKQVYIDAKILKITLAIQPWIIPQEGGKPCFLQVDLILKTF